jgi:hypothetical protein
MVRQVVVLMNILVFLFVFSSCQKEVCDIVSEVPLPKIYTIPGGWQGKFGRGTDQPTLHFATHFKTDGQATVEAEEPVVILLGNWQLVGDSIKTNYTYLPSGDQFFFAAKFVDTIPRIEGYWKGVPPTAGGGTFYLVKF